MVYFAENNTWQNILKTAACNETNIDQLLILSFKILKSETQTMEFISVKFSANSPTAWKVFKYGVISGPHFPAFGLNTGRYKVTNFVKDRLYQRRFSTVLFTHRKQIHV